MPGHSRPEDGVASLAYGRASSFLLLPFMSEAEAKRAGAFFGRRKGHALKPRQAALFDTLLPRLALDLNAPAPADLSALFDDATEVRLESGFGGGEHLIAEAARQPHVGFIGVEPFINGMAKALEYEKFVADLVRVRDLLAQADMAA